MTIRERLWNPYVIVFLSSACIMIIELVASRLMAPRLGVSLYTWTSVIGVILAGISVGNYVGGRLSDRFASVQLLGLVFALAAVGSLSILWLTDRIDAFILPAGMPLMAWIVIYIAGIFFVPGALLGMVSPIIVKLSLTDLRRSGTTVGKIYAWSSVGSIVGTFATGFFLISLFGTRTIVLLVAGLQMLLAIWFLTDTSRRRALASAAAAIAIFLGLFAVLQARDALASDCMLETNYYCIKVHEQEMDGVPVRALVLDRLVHSYANLDDPSHLVYGYEQTYAEVIRPVMERRPDLSALFIGGGGYTFPRYMEALLPESRLVVTEIDPVVTQVAYAALGLDTDTKMEIYDMDARLYMLRHAEDEAFDLVFGDAFNDYSVPFHLTTVEFDQLVANSLREDGLYVVNIVDGGRRGHFLRAYVRTLQEVFPHVAVIPYGTGWEDSVRTTFVVVGSKQPAELSRLPSHTPALTPAELEAYLGQEPARILRDDYVPVDNLLAPVFEDSARGD